MRLAVYVVTSQLVLEKSKCIQQSIELRGIVLLKTFQFFIDVDEIYLVYAQLSPNFK